MTPARIPGDLERLVAEEAFVRSLAKKLVSEEADDLVQQTYLRALERGKAGVRSPRAWLSRILRNVARDRRRDAERRREREAARNAGTWVPSSAELLEREERRRQLVEATDALPGEVRTVVLLRYFDNLPPRRIAKDLGLPVTTVWNRLRRGLELLRERLDRDNGGDRRAWVLPLVPIASGPERGLPGLGLPWGAVPGVVAMTKIKVVVVGSVVVATALVLWPVIAPLTDSPGVMEGGEALAPPPLQVSSDRTVGQEDVAGERTTLGSPVAPSPVARTGSLTIRAVYGEDGTPAADVLVGIEGSSRLDPVFGEELVRTDGRGMARVAGLGPGGVVVSAPGRVGSRTGEVVAGEESTVVLELQAGADIHGQVVDGWGRGVAGAQVVIGQIGIMRPLRAVGTTDEGGGFDLRAVMARCLVGARADGFASSRLYLVDGTEESSVDLRVVLAETGGAVAGTVVDPQGFPVEGAMVQIGSNERDFRVTTENGSATVKPDAPQARTDARGEFRVIGLSSGEHPVQIRAEGLGVWTGVTRVVAGAVTALDAQLVEGVVCEGRVVDVEGEPLAGVEVRVGSWNSLLHYRGQTGADGRFRLTGLPEGEVTVQVDGEKGKASRTLRARAGDRLQWNVLLGSGVVLRGRVLTASGDPAMGVPVEVRTKAVDGSPGWTRFVFTEADGGFVIADCPPGHLLSLVVNEGEPRGTTVENVNPAGGEVVVRLPEGD